MNPAERLAHVESEIAIACQRAGRPRDSVKLIGVSKRKEWRDIRAFLPLGLNAFGENYVQEALGKISSARAENALCAWHFIGNLQSNKARSLPGNFSLFHALDSFSLAKKIDRYAEEARLVQTCLVEVNIDDESSKGGITPSALPAFLEEMNELTNVRVTGLMAIPAPRHGDDSRAPFAKLRELMERCQAEGRYREPLRELSMGMSADFSSAILEGATYVRVGTALFGERT